MNIEELNTQLDYLKETKNLIKQQLIAKGQPVDDNTTFREYADNMNNLVDTTDANATSDDVILNKTAYVNGQRVTGTLETTDAISIDNSNNTDTYLTLMNMGNIPSIVVGADINDLYGDKKVVEDGVGLEIIAPQSQFADVIGLTTDKIKQGETILGVVGSVVELNGDTETVTPTTSQQVITPTSPKNGFTQVTVNAVTSAIDNNIKTENIKSGITILGVSGKSSVVDTSDADATATDIVENKTAYVNGNKVVGNMHLAGGIVAGQNYHRFKGTSFDLNLNGLPRSLIFNTDNLSQNGYIPAGRYVQVWADIDALNSYIGLTADKIKSGETILGITGTYTGSSMKEYASEAAMNNDIANIAEGELVKVVASGVTTYYIKETISGTATMTKLVKESETMSPQEYTDANDIADEVLGN